MKAALLFFALLPCIIFGQVPNPEFIRGDSCPWGMSGINCELKAPPWFCASGSPDGFDTCACGPWWGMCLPVNVFGDFSPATQAAGLYTYSGNPHHPDEWIGSPAGTVIGWFKFSGSFCISPISGYLGNPYLVVGDSFKIPLSTAPGWQEVEFYARTHTPADSIYIGGWTGDTTLRPGPNLSCYLLMRKIQVLPINQIYLPSNGKRNL